ncbi:sulfatase-like hydrolase/transferase [Cerasicoccus frondis]|uniref:sulfatase-like hydrolase/transferase n=1 Tax=Cerasicoccus frondis TaxID=490090 RepID=UPI002852541F|nr:sulfatase-like hydrolase/transferase [Cerasicoccus frondis]
MSETPPNVVVFFTDQQRWDCSGLHGNPLELMPNFDRMARMGTHVAQSFTCQPVCGPARSCFQTGQYATRTGCYRNGIPLPEDVPTIAQSFNEAGYRTGYIGKWHLGDENSRGPVRPAQRGGYQEWLASNILEFTSDAFEVHLYDEEEKEHFLPGYRVDAIADASIRFIQQNKDKPFFLFSSYIEPHHQNWTNSFPAPPGYAERYQGRWLPPDLAELGGNAHRHIGGYYGMVKRLDEALGRVLDALKSLKLSESTIVLFTSDHGNHFATRNREFKRSCHDSSLRVPTAFCGPGFNGGGQIQEVVSLVDLPATLIDAAGLEMPETLQGRSIMPLLNGKQAEWPEEVFAQISESEVGRVIRTKRWKYAVSAEGLDPVANSCADIYQEEYLYDLASDPYELFNLAGSVNHRELCDSLAERLILRMVECGEDAPVILPAPQRSVGVQINPRA